MKVEVYYGNTEDAQFVVTNYCSSDDEVVITENCLRWENVDAYLIHNVCLGNYLKVLVYDDDLISLRLGNSPNIMFCEYVRKNQIRNLFVVKTDGSKVLVPDAIIIKLSLKGSNIPIPYMIKHEGRDLTVYSLEYADVFLNTKLDSYDYDSRRRLIHFFNLTSRLTELKVRLPVVGIIKFPAVFIYNEKRYTLGTTEYAIMFETQYPRDYSHLECEIIKAYLNTLSEHWDYLFPLSSLFYKELNR